ncbi:MULTISPECIES: type II restriction endonuclease [unclassified Azospirillum]|uniref:type II restriction endonuclease n=2 Tax=unclassified Azospirillum TaxID=2630922 RepID=UPI001B3B5A2C|nr:MULTISPECIES: type II restriction endonuclease [unclassified Azospirillum]MDR6774761.1 type II restriction enzyme [Azospirillum sp. BE72]
MSDPMRALIQRWREDAGATYRTWFLWDERVKNFRSIRRGIQQVVTDIETSTFGNAYRGSSLETVVHSIAEQRQIFKGADHAFLWKPKLRIPDIYENPDNQRAFGRLLDACVCCNAEPQILAAIRQIDARQIKGLGPAVANLLYFLHPTLVPPFNTAIVNGYNALTGAKVKLGRWDEFLAMRQGILALNAEYRDLLSNDLGAIGGLLFDVGSGRYAAPPRTNDAAARSAWEADLAKLREESVKASKAAAAEREGDRTHTEIQGWLRDLGKALGYDVWIAANDRSRAYDGGKLGEGCLERLPEAIEKAPGADAIRLIDVLWLDRGKAHVAAAFEVEHSTSIYSGVVRMLDLALGTEAHALEGMFLVAPNGREDEVRAQLTRPAFSRVADLQVRYLPYGELESHRESIARFGSGMKAINAIARTLV